jgi:hypothetical protein
VHLSCKRKKEMMKRKKRETRCIGSFGVSLSFSAQSRKETKRMTTFEYERIPFFKVIFSDFLFFLANLHSQLLCGGRGAVFCRVCGDILPSNHFSVTENRKRSTDKKKVLDNEQEFITFIFIYFLLFLLIYFSISF